MKVKLKKPEIGIILAYRRDPKDMDSLDLVLRFPAHKILTDSIDLELDEDDDGITLNILKEFPHIKA